MSLGIGINDLDEQKRRLAQMQMAQMRLDGSPAEPPQLEETQGGLDALGRWVGGLPDKFQREWPAFKAGIGALVDDPSQARNLPMVKQIESGVTMARDVAEGKIDPLSDEGIQRAQEMAGVANLGSVTATAPEGALASNLARRRSGGPRAALTAEEIAEKAARAEAGQAPPAGMTPVEVQKAADDAQAMSSLFLMDRYKRAVPQFADQYPQAGGFEIKQKGTVSKPREGTYEAKVQTAEEQELMAARKQVTEDMKREKWTPYFDPAKRADVDPANYPRTGSTQESATAATAATRDKWYDYASLPDATARLKGAYEHGERIGDAGNWYFMKQLEDEFIKHYGEDEGRKQFSQKFAGAMAATTAGMSPTNNLLAAHYGNYLREKGMPFPEKAHEVPSPLGGPYTQSNLAEYERTFVGDNAPMTSDVKGNPKRFDFEAAFLGHTNPVIDKQISQLFNPKINQPKDYGQFSRRISELAAQYGVSPRYFQEVAWGGAKNLKTRNTPPRDPNVLWNDPEGLGGGFQPTPMISIVNEAIERTSRLTGRSPDDVLLESIIKSEKPLYEKGVPLPAQEPEKKKKRLGPLA